MPNMRGTAVYNKYCGSGGGSAPASGGGGYTPQQQMLLQGAGSLGFAIGSALHDGLFGNPQDDAAAEAAAEAAAQAAAQEAARAAAEAAAEQQRRADELARRAEEIKGQLLGRTGGADSSTSLSLTGVQDTSELKLMTVNQTPFFGKEGPKCPPSQDASVVDLCGAGDMPAIIKIDPATASQGGAGLTNGQPDAVIRTLPSETASTGTDALSAASRQSAAKATQPVSDGSAVALDKLVPLLRQAHSADAGPIATSNRPAICVPLSRQLDETYQLARLAVLASDVYERYDPKTIVSPVMAGFDRISDNGTEMQQGEMQRLFPGMDSKAIKNLLEPDNSGYRAAIYQDSARTKIFLVFRGTSTADDWRHGNFPQAAGLGSDYYTNAIALADMLKKSTAVAGDGLELIGHSMGGGMADAAGLANKIKTTTFNPSGVNPNSVKDADMSTAQLYLTDYVVDGEPLNAHQDHPALTMAQVYADSAIAAPLIPAALGALAATDDTFGDVKQSLQELQSLYSAPLPAAIGRRVMLGPDPADLHSKDPFRLHLMDGVVDAIIAHSRDLYGQYLFNTCGS